MAGVSIDGRSHRGIRDQRSLIRSGQVMVMIWSMSMPVPVMCVCVCLSVVSVGQCVKRPKGSASQAELLRTPYRKW